MKKTEKRKGNRKVWIVLLIILGVLVIGGLIAMAVAEPGRREAMNVIVDDVDFSSLKDGVYVGTYQGVKDSLRNCKVQVTVKAGAVTGIKVLEGALAKGDKPVELRGGMTIDDLFGKVMKSRSLQVDVISGATITSKVHLKAVEDALEQAQGN